MPGTIAIPDSLLIWCGGLIVSAVIAIMSFACHLLLKIYTRVADIDRNTTRDKTEIRADIAMLKRHDERNREEIQMLQHHLRTQE